jgi:hypothetical protein
MLEVWIDYQGLVGKEDQDGVLEALGTFAKLGAVGGLAGANVDPAQASISLATSDFAAQSSHLVYQHVHIDPASVFILLNMIHWIHLEVIPVKSVRLAWAAIRTMKNPMEIQFPGEWSRLSVPLEVGELLDDIDIDIEFDKPEPTDVTARVVDAMSMWLLASHRGAYADDAFNPSKTAIYLGPDVMNVSSNRIIWFIEILRCNASALDGLINLLEWVHRHVAPIRQVSIGP